MRKLILIFLFLIVVAGCSDNEPSQEPPKLDLETRAATVDNAVTAKSKGAPVIPEELVQLAEAGDVKAQIKLGKLYDNNGEKALAYEWLLRAAETGDVDAQYFLGELCQTASFDKNDECVVREAYSWYQKAAEQGAFMAQFAMSRYYIDGRHAPQDHTRALYWAMQYHDNINDFNVWLNYAELNDYNEYYCSEEGWRYQQQRVWFMPVMMLFKEEFEFNSEVLSAEEFLNWVQQKADAGDVIGKALLGHMYYLGFLVERDYAKAYELYLETEAFQASSLISLSGYFKEGKPVANIDDLIKLANGGDEEAMQRLGYEYYFGWYVKHDHTESIKWFTMLMQVSNDPKIRLDAQIILGCIYSDYFGNTTTVIANMPYRTEPAYKNYTQAAKWYELAAEAGSVFAQYELGDFYAKGLGVEKDYEKAVCWFNRAALGERKFSDSSRVEPSDQTYYSLLGYHWNDAAYRLGMLYADENGGVFDSELAVKWLQKAVGGGHKLAMYQLAQMYANGQGVKQNYNKAAKLYRRIIGEWWGAGFVDDDFGPYETEKRIEAEAYFALGELYAKGHGVKQDLSTAFSAFGLLLNPA